MLKRAVIFLAMLVVNAHAQTSFNARTWLFTQNVTRAASEARFLQCFQAESLQLDILAREETNVLHQLGALDLSATNLLHVWECAADTNIHTVYFAVTGTVQDATNGHVRYRVTPAGANLLAGNYLGFARVLQNVNGTNVRMGVLQQQRIQVLESVDSDLYDVVGPITQTSYVQNVIDGGTSGSVGVITRSGGNVTVIFPEPLAGSGDMLKSVYDVNTNGVVDDAAALGGTAAAAYATDVDLASATGAIWTAIGTKIGPAGVTFTNADNNGTVGTGSNHFARGSAVTDEASARTTADNIITVRVGVAEAAITSEAATRLAADNVITVRVGVAEAAITSEAATRLANDNTATTRIGGVEADVATIPRGDKIIFGGVTNTGTGVVFQIGGSVTNVIKTNGQIVVQSKDDNTAAATNSGPVASFPIYNRTDWTGQWSIVESGEAFGQTMTLMAWEFRLDGGTQTVDLLDIAPTGAYTTNTAALLVVGYTSVVPSVTTLAAGHRLGVKLYDGASWTNRLIGGVRGKP